jgi:hypothetical protein
MEFAWLIHLLPGIPALAAADHFSRHILTNLALRIAIVEQRVFGVGMHINEAGSDDLARRVNYLRGLCIIKTPDSDNTPGTDANISFDPWIPGTVDNVATAD